jgi:hypothetical protein
MEWKQHPIFKIYEISSSGHVRNISTRNFISPWVCPHGYLRQRLKLENKYMNRFVHVLVLEAFVSLRPAGLLPNHKDGKKQNNSVSNLEWVTPQENVKHSFKLGLSTTIGSSHPRSKLTDEEVLEIKSKLIKGMGIYEIMRLYNYKVSYSVIYHIKYNKTWKHLRKLSR